MTTDLPILITDAVPRRTMGAIPKITMDVEPLLITDAVPLRTMGAVPKMTTDLPILITDAVPLWSMNAGLAITTDTSMTKDAGPTKTMGTVVNKMGAKPTIRHGTGEK